jgi:hypothetical protein
VKSNPSTEEDFMSHQSLGRVPPQAIQQDPERRRSWDRVSVFDTEGGARRVARASRGMRLGRYIAELLIPTDHGDEFALEKTGSHGHYDIDARPRALLACVSRVIPVGEDPRSDM